MRLLCMCCQLAVSLKSQARLQKRSFCFFLYAHRHREAKLQLEEGGWRSSFPHPASFCIWAASAAARRRAAAAMDDRAQLEEGACFVEVTPEALDAGAYLARVGDPGAGALASFVGVTRNSFQGKAVERLKYEAYVPMAAKKLMVRCGAVCLPGVEGRGRQALPASAGRPQRLQAVKLAARPLTRWGRGCVLPRRR